MLRTRRDIDLACKDAEFDSDFNISDLEVFGLRSLEAENRVNELTFFSFPAWRHQIHRNECQFLEV